MRGIKLACAFFLLASPALGQATWNSGKCDASITLSNGNLTATSSSSGAWKSCYATSNSRHTGKWYFRIKAVAMDASSGWMGGVGNVSGTTASFCGSTANGISSQQRVSTGIWKGGISIGNAQSIAANNDYLVVAVNLDSNLFWATAMTAAGVLNLAWNNSLSNSPAAATGGLDMASVNDGAAVFPCMSGFTSGAADIATLDTTTVVSDATLGGFLLWDGSSGPLPGSRLLRGVGK